MTNLLNLFTLKHTAKPCWKHQLTKLENVKDVRRRAGCYLNTAQKTALQPPQLYNAAVTTQMTEDFPFSAHCWMGDRKGIRPVETGCWFIGGYKLTGTLHDFDL